MSEPDVQRYLPPPPEAEAWGICVSAGGRTRIAPGTVYPPAGHPRSHAFRWPEGRILREFQLVYLARGQGELVTTGAGRQSVKAGQAFLLIPGEWHAYRPSPAIGWDEWWLAFTGSVPERLLAHGCIDHHRPVLDGRGDRSLFTALHGAIAAIEHQRRGWAGLAAAGVLTALARLHAGGDDDPVMATAAVRLHEASDRPVDLVRLATESGLSPAQFRRRFAAAHGLPPRDYHLRLRLDRAMALLADPGVTMAEAAAAMGFSSPFHLSRLCRRHLGSSPRRRLG